MFVFIWNVDQKGDACRVPLHMVCILACVAFCMCACSVNVLMFCMTLWIGSELSLLGPFRPQHATNGILSVWISVSLTRRAPHKKQTKASDLQEYKHTNLSIHENMYAYACMQARTHAKITICEDICLHKTLRRSTFERMCIERICILLHVRMQTHTYICSTNSNKRFCFQSYCINLYQENMWVTDFYSFHMGLYTSCIPTYTHKPTDLHELHHVFNGQMHAFHNQRLSARFVRGDDSVQPVKDHRALPLVSH